MCYRGSTALRFDGPFFPRHRRCHRCGGSEGLRVLHRSFMQFVCSENVQVSGRHSGCLSHGFGSDRAEIWCSVTQRSYVCSRDRRFQTSKIKARTECDGRNSCKLSNQSVVRHDTHINVISCVGRGPTDGDGTSRDAPVPAAPPLPSIVAGYAAVRSLARPITLISSQL